MLKNENGITLVSLVIMVIVIAILATVATYTGVSTYRNIQKTAMIKRLETVEEKVESIRKRAEVDSELKSKIDNDLLGNDLNNDHKNIISGSTDHYRYFSNENLEQQLNIKDIEGSYLINLKDGGTVYSVEGIFLGSGNEKAYSISEIKNK